MAAAAAAAALPASAAEQGQLEPDDVVGEVDEELVCSLCTCVLKQPHSCQAGHTFCRECIAEWFQRSQTCPVDREPLGSLETLTRQRPLENMISRLTVRCPYHGVENGRPAKKRRASRPDENPSEPQAAQQGRRRLQLDRPPVRSGNAPGKRLRLCTEALRARGMWREGAGGGARCARRVMQAPTSRLRTLQHALQSPLA